MFRPPNKIGEYAELGDVTRDSVKADEEQFIKVFASLCYSELTANIGAKVCRKRAKLNGGKLKYFDIHKTEKETEVQKIPEFSCDFTFF